MKTLLRLYPNAWRVRYEAEVMAVLEQRGSRFADAPDMIRGAVDAHLHPISKVQPILPGSGVPESLHRAGRSAVVGGLLWFLAYVGVYLHALVYTSMNHGIAASEGQGWLMGLLVAPVLLVIAQWDIMRSSTADRLRARIPVLLSAFGAFVMTAKLFLNLIRPDRHLLGGWGFPELWVVGMFILVTGTFAFALVLLGARALPRKAVVLLLAGSLLNAAFLLVIGATDMLNALRYSSGIPISGALYGLGWIVVGVTLLRRHSAVSLNPSDAVVS